MSWTYSQRTGTLTLNGTPVATGYSGHEEGKNNPAMQNVRQIGPVPQGKYTIGAAYQHPEKGPVVMRLNPDAHNLMFGRSGFLIHGDSLAHPGFASEGCIILARKIRDRIAQSSDRELEVTA